MCVSCDQIAGDSLSSLPFCILCCIVKCALCMMLQYFNEFNDSVSFNMLDLSLKDDVTICEANRVETRDVDPNADKIDAGEC